MYNGDVAAHDVLTWSYNTASYAIGVAGAAVQLYSCSLAHQQLVHAARHAAIATARCVAHCSAL